MNFIFLITCRKITEIGLEFYQVLKIFKFCPHIFSNIFDFYNRQKQMVETVVAEKN